MSQPRTSQSDHGRFEGRRPPLSADLLRVDCEAVAGAIEGFIKDSVVTQLRKRGAVIGISGGIDSSVTAALCARALGPEHVFGLFTPERESSEETLGLSRLVAETFGVESALEDITSLLEAANAYQRRDDAFQEVIPAYGDGWKAKVVLPSVLEKTDFRVFSVVAQSPTGETIRKRLTPHAYLTIIAATSFKQRSRKMIEYFHADRLNYAVAGTPNRLEIDQGFFVKQGDGAADLKPIAHLYKSQVYQLAEHLGVPGEVRRRPPTTDTYSLPQGQDEFYFSLPYHSMDLCLFAKNHGYEAAEVADVLELTAEQAEAVYRDIDAKRRATRYQHLSPLLVEPSLAMADLGDL